MLPYTLNDQPRQCRTSWEEVSLAEYVQLRTGNQMEAVCVLAGITLEELQRVDPVGFAVLETATDLLATEPQGTRPEWLPYSLGAASIGKLELCKHYLRMFEEAPEQAMPYIYAVYAYAGEYDTVLSLSGAGFPSTLLEQAGALPVTETIGAINHILKEIDRIGNRYAPILDKDPEAEEVMANVARFEKYGFYATLVASASGHWGSMAVLVEMPADSFYTAMCVDTERSEYIEALQEIKSNRQTA